MQPKQVELWQNGQIHHNKMWKDFALTKAARESIGIDCARLWNIAPNAVKNATTLVGAKREIKIFCKSLEL